MNDPAQSPESGASLLEQLASEPTLYKEKAAFRRVFILALCLVPLALIGAFALRTGRGTYALAALPFLATGALAWLYMAAGQLDRGFKVAMFGAWISLAIILILFNGIRSASVSGFCLILTVAGWFAGLRAGLILTVATIGLFAFFSLAESNAWSYPVMVRNPSWYVFLVHSLLAVCAGAVGFLAARSFGAHLVEERNARAALASSLVRLQMRERELDQAQVRLRDMNQDLERRVAERTARLQSLTRELSDFSYSISHDLRTPLRAINGQSSLLLEEEGALLSPTALRRLEAIASSSDQMGKMVDTLLMVIRLGQTRIRRDPIHMGNLVANAAAPLLAKYTSARLGVSELPPAQADPVLVRQLVEILLDNAFKYSARRASAQVDAGWDARQGAWFVRDNGIGFDMRYADRLWGLFERLHGAEHASGLGIGLAVADRIVQCHGGDIWAQSAPEQGATFYFTLAPAGQKTLASPLADINPERRGQLGGRPQG